MHEEYKHLMAQQVFSAESDLLQKLEQHVPAKRIPTGRKTLILVICLCLLIPTAVFAAETVFDLTSVKIYPGKDFEGNGAVIYDIDFGTVKELPLSDFPEKWQYLDDGQFVFYDSWAQAQEDLGIDLMENTLLEQEYTADKSFHTEAWSGRKEPIHCYTLYRAYEGQLYSFSSYAVYRKDGSRVYLTAEALVAHPNIPDEVKKVFSGDQYILKSESDAEKFHTETYTSASGLVATIVTYPMSDGSSNYCALFRANGVLYTVSPAETNEAGRTILIALLEGFTF